LLLKFGCFDEDGAGGEFQPGILDSTRNQAKGAVLRDTKEHSGTHQDLCAAERRAEFIASLHLGEVTGLEGHGLSADGDIALGVMDEARLCCDYVLGIHDRPKA